MRKTISVALATVMISMAFSSVSANSGHGNVERPTVKDVVNKKEMLLIEAMELELNAVEDKIMGEARSLLSGKSSAEANEIMYNKSAVIKEEFEEIQAKYGFLPVEDINSLISPMSASNDVTLTDSLTYNSTTQTYFYSGEWQWNNNYDPYEDLEDLAALRLTNASGWLITKSYAKTWDNYGLQTGYVDEFGQHTPSNSLVTKRFEDAGGVVFNVIDSWYAAHLPVYETYKGRCSMYFKKTSSTASSTKAILDFHHNWKTYVWNASASFNNIGLTGVSYQLTVTYTAANKNWQRSSGGRTAS